MDAKAAEANRLALPPFSPSDGRQLADISPMCNPLLFGIGTIRLMITAYADNTVEFECTDVYMKVGGRATIRKADMPITYAQILKYGSTSGKRVMRACWVGDSESGRIRIVLGKAKTDTRIEFRTVDWEIELQPVPQPELNRILTQFTEMSIGRQRGPQVAGIAAALRAMST